ncbi:prostate stem cell antigen-like [Limanda limanda]|uniref:prostate stem cell antigen-like n=1 Tax=Limanda limanda TaxID=27771 RepID=UPI0029C952D1|nr:prostate stem cell antigen-like [Limanda limanda]
MCPLPRADWETPHVYYEAWCHHGQALQCYKCNLGMWGSCITRKDDCTNGSLCFSGVGRAAGFVDLYKKGCLVKRRCNQTNEWKLTDNSNYRFWSITRTCCNTDLCNAAPGLPGASGLSLALATITALLMAQVLV